MNIWNKFSALIVLGLFAITGIALADFESDTTPVDMRDYWPSSKYIVQTWRLFDGSLYVKRITKPYPYDPMLYWETKNAGEDHFSREDYYPDPNNRTEAAYFSNSWSMAKMPDKSVLEVADSFAPNFPNCSYLADWATGPGQVYTGGAIIHGRPGGHTIGENYYYQMDVPMNWTPNLQTTAPSPCAGTYVYTLLRMEKRYNTFTPYYGRNSDRVWGKGNAKTYNNVILMVFQHGTKLPNVADKVWQNAPSWFYHVPNYVSFVEYLWLAPGVGPIQEMILFDERSGSGYVVADPAAQPYWVNYIDIDGTQN